MTLTTSIMEVAGEELQAFKKGLKQSCDRSDHVAQDGGSKGDGARPLSKGVESPGDIDLDAPGPTGHGHGAPIELASAIDADAARLQQDRVLAELSELERENRWEDIVALCWPLSEKYPVLVDLGMDDEIRRRLAFALVQCRRHDEAIKTLAPLVEAYPDDFMVHYSCAYCAYDALYRHKNKEILLSPQRKKELIALGHRHFRACVRIRPDSVTAYYRDAMLYKEIEGKTKKAIPLFKQAVANWERLGKEELESRHQERPKYIRSMYHLASCYLNESLAHRSKTLLEQVLKEDAETGYIKDVFKHFAMAKTLFRLGDYRQALDHIDVAEAASRPAVPDFVRELRAGCLLMMKRPEHALQEIDRIPTRAMRPYVRWRRADILVALGRHNEAISTLEQGLDRDNRSRHKTLLRMARIHYSLGQFHKGLACAKKAGNFYSRTYGNKLDDADFMAAICLHGMGKAYQALSILNELNRKRYSCPGFKDALLAIKASCARETGHSLGKAAIH